MQNNDIIEKMQELFEKNNIVYKEICKTMSNNTIDSDSIQEALFSLPRTENIGVEVSRELYFYLKYKLNNYIIIKREEKYPDTLYNCPIVINPKLKDYEYKIIRKEKE